MSILLSGCGGGYDVFCTIPLFFEYQKKKKNIIVVSLSFTKVRLLEKLTIENQIEKLKSNLYFVDAKKMVNKEYDYFPEYYLSRHLQQGVYVIIIKQSTIKQITEAYNVIIHKKNIIKFYLVDGGCDLLLSGKESDLATPVEDMMHLKAVVNLPIKRKYACAVGMTCDCNSVPKNELLDRLKEIEDILISKHIWSLTDPYVKKYYDIFYKSKPTNSIVNSLICSTLEGRVGYYLPKHLKLRIRNNNVELDQLMITFVQYDLIKLSNRILYLDELDINHDIDEIDDYIMNFNRNILYS